MIPPEQNADFVCAMEQVLDVYKRPYDKDCPVVCLDESPRQLIAATRKPIKKQNGETLHDYEYQRNGVCDIYMLFEPLGGRRHLRVTDTHNRLDWAAIVAELAGRIYPAAKKITLVQDNLSAHKPSALYELFEPQQARGILDKIEFVYTPKHGSWLNMAECELSVLARQCLSERIADKRTLTKKVKAWESQRNEKQTTTNWRFTTKDARIKLKKLYPTYEA